MKTYNIIFYKKNYLELCFGDIENVVINKDFIDYIDSIILKETVFKLKKSIRKESCPFYIPRYFRDYIIDYNLKNNIRNINEFPVYVASLYNIKKFLNLILLDKTFSNLVK